MSSFHFDDRALKRIAEQGMENVTAGLNRDLNGLTARCQGRPLEEIKQEIQQVWSRHMGGGYVGEPDLTRFADAIQQGGTVEVRAGSNSVA
ncbi:hypothetical protein [Streptomyces pseudovenezuelae]|uniref:hypothetical protein n=1 Tax=Streptomyces pseudovenezuelae TaxID=67350 RepID=UPI002E7FEEA2|nr:hypothetical protein [Streptomyces pseudovenezuelae]WUA94425.1 hypothetical protein OHO81_45110 [Streptomyces pseudovenezuelae]